MKRTLRHAVILLLGLLFFVAPGAAAYALWSTTATGTLAVDTAAPGPPPNAPTTFICTDMERSYDRADFTWTAVSGAASYRIYELSGGSAYLRRDNISGASVTNLTQTEGAGPRQSTQVLVVRAVATDGQESADSNAVSVDYDDNASCGAPPTPTNPTVTFTVCGEAVYSWNASAYATSFVVSWRGVASGPWTDLPPVTATSVTLTQAQFGGDDVIYVRVAAVNLAGASTPTGGRTVDFQPPSPCDPLVYFLDNPGTGNTASSTHLTLKTGTPGASTLANYDTNRDSFAGLLLAKGSGLGETDSAKHQVWSLSSPVAKNGPVSLTLWSAMKGFDTTKQGSVVAGLYQCDDNNNFTNCSLLGSATVASSGSWSGGSNTWVQKTWNFGTLDVNIPSNKRLYVKLVVNPSSDDDMWFAYDTAAYQSALTIG